MAKQIVSVLVGLLLMAHLTIFFWLYLDGRFVLVFLAGAAVPIFWGVIATASLGVERQPVAFVVLGKCVVFTVYTVFAAAFVAALVVAGPWGWARFTSLGAMGILAFALRRNSKYLAAKYGW